MMNIMGEKCQMLWEHFTGSLTQSGVEGEGQGRAFVFFTIPATELVT